MSTPVVLITGALTGIGRATAVAFAKEAARLVISGRDEVWARRQSEVIDGVVDCHLRRWYRAAHGGDATSRPICATTSAKAA